VVALPLTAVSSQYVIGSFEARFFARTENGVTVQLHSSRMLRGQIARPPFCGV
jgi:hypothetical protein